MILERRARSCTMPGKMRGSSGLGSLSPRQGIFWAADGSIVIVVVDECDRSRNVLLLLLLLLSPGGAGVWRRSVLEWEPVNRASCAAAAAAADGDGELMVLIRMRLEGDGGNSGEVGFACVGAGAVYRSILDGKLAEISRIWDFSCYVHR